MLEDGTPPPISVVIERVCSGAAHSEGYTDSQGYFSVQLGSHTGMLEDASEGGGDSGGVFSHGSSLAIGAGPISRYAICDLRARLGGYRSQGVSLMNHGLMENPDIGVILLHRVGPEEAPTVTISDLKASKPARKAMQRGLDLVRKQKTDEAVKSFQEAAKADPEYAAAWCELGKAQAATGHPAEARESFEIAAKDEPRWVDPLLELSLLAIRAGNWQELSDRTDRIIRLDSFQYPQAFFFNAVANYNLGREDVAERSVREALRLDTRHQYPQIAHLFATILVDHHRYAEAATELKSYLALAPTAHDASTVRKQLNDIEKVALLQYSGEAK